MRVWHAVGASGPYAGVARSPGVFCDGEGVYSPRSPMEGCRAVGVVWGGRLRLSLGQPATRVAWHGQRDEGIAEGLGVPGHGLDCPFPGVGFVGFQALLDVGRPMCQQARD